MNNTQRTTPRKVNPFQNPDDFECALMGELGMSHDYIIARTNLTRHQSRYRLKKFGISVKGYRNGTGRVSNTIISQVKQLARPEVYSSLRSRLEQLE
jgi:hypothetical protein